MLFTLLVSLALGAEPAVPPEVRQYLNQRITVKRYVYAGSNRVYKTSYYQNGQWLFGGEVYDVLGRPELAAEYKDRNATNWAMGLGGVGALVGSVALLAFVDSRLDWQDADTECSPDASAAQADCVAAVEAANNRRDVIAGTTLVTSGVLALGGVVSLSIPIWFRSPEPIPDDETDWLIQQYNERLAAELGVVPTATLNPWFAPGTVGVGLTFNL